MGRRYLGVKSIGGSLLCGLFAVSTGSGCGRAVCEGKNDGCLALRVDGYDSGKPVFIEILDAFGKRLDYRQTTGDESRPLIEVPVDRQRYSPADARCLRVWTGEGTTRKTALVKLTNWTEGRLDGQVMLSVPPALETFSKVERATIPTTNKGRSVTIGRVPGEPQPMVLIGSKTASDTGIIQFIRTGSGGVWTEVLSQRLTVAAAPYPLALSSSADGSAVLVVGNDSLILATPTVAPMIFFASLGTKFKNPGMPLPIPSNSQVTFVAAAAVNRQEQIVAVSWVDKPMTPTNCGTTIYKTMGTMLGLSQELPPGSSCTNTSATAIADLNDDGVPDILRSFKDTLEVFSTSGMPGSYSLLTSLRVDNMERLLGLAVGDLNGDGIRDVAIGNNENAIGQPAQSLQIFLAEPKTPGKLVSTPKPPTLPAVFPRAAVAVDLNGDFIDDVVVASFGDTPPVELLALSVVHGNAAGMFLDGKVLEAPWADHLYDVAAGDVDDDCQADLVSVDRDKDTISVQMNKTLTVQQLKPTASP